LDISVGKLSGIRSGPAKYGVHIPAWETAPALFHSVCYSYGAHPGSNGHRGLLLGRGEGSEVAAVCRWLPTHLHLLPTSACKVFYRYHPTFLPALCLFQDREHLI